MGIKLLWLGLTMLMAFSGIISVPAIEAVGKVIMIIGLVLFLLDK